MTSSKRPYFSTTTVSLLLAALFFNCRDAAAGTITITTNAMTDQTNNVNVASGYADANLAVQFNGAAKCTCESPSLTYTWYFDDNTTGNGATRSHTYGSTGAGERSPHLHCHCDNCGADADAPNLSVSAISGIQITKIGDIANPTNNGRLCFDAVLTVTASALPAGVNGSNLIDWYLDDTVQLVNTSNGTLPSLGSWPKYNYTGTWGARTLYVQIDGPHNSPSQDGELNLTGTASYVNNDQSINCFFDLSGTQNPSTLNPKPPNWYFYWSQTSAYAGTMNYDGTQGPGESGYTTFTGGAWTCYLCPNACNSAGGGCWGASGIDFFANLCRHEDQHRSDFTAMWGANSGVVAAQDGDGDWLKDNMEATLIAGHAYDPKNPITYNDTFGYNNPAGGPLEDAEDLALRREQAWVNGTAKAEDWAHPGQQWP